MLSQQHRMPGQVGKPDAAYYSSHSLSLSASALSIRETLIKRTYGNPPTPVFLRYRSRWKFYASRNRRRDIATVPFTTDRETGAGSRREIIRPSRASRAAYGVWARAAAAGPRDPAESECRSPGPGFRAFWRTRPAEYRLYSHHHSVFPGAEDWRLRQTLSRRPIPALRGHYAQTRRTIAGGRSRHSHCRPAN